MAINDKQVKTRLGKKLDGTPAYSDLSKIVVSQLPTLDKDNRVTLTLAGTVDVKILSAGEFPAGNVFINGSSYEGINGGFACATVAGALGTAETTQNQIGGRVVNCVRILDAGHDEPLKVEYEGGKLTEAKYVFGLIQTTIGEGQPTVADQAQVSFVVYDDATDAFKAHPIEAGTYYFEPVKMYNVGTASEVNRLGAILSGEQGLGGVGLDELSELFAGVNGFSSCVMNTEQLLDSAVVSVNITGVATTEWKDSAGVALDGALTQEGRKIYAPASATKKAYTSERMSVTYNGVELPIEKCTIVDTTTMTIDLSDTLVGVQTYSNDRLEIRW